MAGTAGREEVIEWIRLHARLVKTIDPRASLADLTPVRDMVRGARVVGLGGATHGAHELSAIKHRIFRFLVEEMGFRSLALEEDWTKGAELDDYVCTGSGDLKALLADASPFWRTEEMVDLIGWLRSYNEGHPNDPLRVVGLESDSVRAIAYDSVTDYVRRAAPARLPELEAHYASIRPTEGIAEHVARYRAQLNKEPCIDHARFAYELVASLSMREGHALALQQARVIVDFHQGHAAESIVDYVEQRLADNALWWHQYTARKLVYWSSNSHMANGNPRIISYQTEGPRKPQRSAGSYLRERLGRDYVAIGLIFDHGLVPFVVRSPSPEFVDFILGRIGLDTYLLDLRGPIPDVVQTWLSAPTKTRLIFPNYSSEQDAMFYMAGGSIADWFDIIIHTQEVTPSHLMTAEA
jgi:erythromycin esterase